MLTEFSSQTVLRKRTKLSEQFFARAKRTEKIFDPVGAVLSMKLLSPGCTLVTLRSETKWYISTPDPHLILVVGTKMLYPRKIDPI